MDGWPEEPLTTGEICISQPGSCCKPNQTGSRFGFASVPRDIRHVRTNCSCAETAYLADKIGLSFFKKITWYQSKSKNISIIISNFRTLDTRFARMHAKHLQERSYRFPGSRSAAAVTSGLETGSHVLRIAKGQGPRVKAPAAQAARPCRNGLSRMLASNRDAGRGRICCTAPLNALLGARLVTK
jgi:hypothetical protein